MSVTPGCSDEALGPSYPSPTTASTPDPRLHGACGASSTPRSPRRAVRASVRPVSGRARSTRQRHRTESNRGARRIPCRRIGGRGDQWSGSAVDVARAAAVDNRIGVQRTQADRALDPVHLRPVFAGATRSVGRSGFAGAPWRLCLVERTAGSGIRLYAQSLRSDPRTARRKLLIRSRNTAHPCADFARLSPGTEPARTRSGVRT